MTNIKHFWSHVINIAVDPLRSHPHYGTGSFPTVNDSVNFSHDKPHVFKPNAAGYVGLAVTVVFPSFSCKKPSKLSNEGLTDEVRFNKETEEA